MAIILISAFVCFWSWHFFLKLNPELSLKTGNFQKWFLPLLPWAGSVLLFTINGMYIGLVAWILWISNLRAKKGFLTVYIQALACVSVAAMGLEFFMQKLSMFTQTMEPPVWIFWLGDTGWLGALLGFAIGCAFTTIHREKGHVWWIAPAMILSGIGSLGLAWGIFLGDRWDWKDKNNTIFSLVGLALGAFAMAVYPPGMKDILWLTACLVWICLENLIFRRQAKV